MVLATVFGMVLGASASVAASSPARVGAPDGVALAGLTLDWTTLQVRARRAIAGYLASHLRPLGPVFWWLEVPPESRADVGWTPPPVLVAAPVEGALSSPFGYRRDPFRRRRRKLHRGLDFRAKRRTPVVAAGTGVVVRAGWWGSYGRVVVVDHGDGLETRYAHLRRVHVRKGETVSAGHRIGQVGSSGRSTGPHLHFEIRRDNRAVNPESEMADILSPRRETLAHRR